MSSNFLILVGVIFSLPIFIILILYSIQLVLHFIQSIKDMFIHSENDLSYNHNKEAKLKDYTKGAKFF